MERESVIKPAAIAKKRQLSGSGPSSPKKKISSGISAHDRIQEFPGEGLEISAGKLFCGGCLKTLELKKSTIEDHIGSKAHEANRNRGLKEKLRQQEISKTWEKFKRQNSQMPSGSTLEGERLFRIDLVR